MSALNPHAPGPTHSMRAHGRGDATGLETPRGDFWLLNARVRETSGHFYYLLPEALGHSELKIKYVL